MNANVDAFSYVWGHREHTLAIIVKGVIKINPESIRKLKGPTSFTSKIYDYKFMI